MPTKDDYVNFMQWAALGKGGKHPPGQNATFTPNELALAESIASFYVRLEAVEAKVTELENG